MYLVFAETDSLPPGWMAKVVFKRFIFDQIRDNYLTLGDSGGKVRRFHGIKTTWGISHLISIAKFSDPSYGYLVIDICEFGVELFVLENTHGSECLTLKEGATLTHTWKIKQFSQIQKNYCYSSIFDTADGSKWKIQINPKGGGEEKNKSLSLYLSLADSETSAPGGKVYTEFILRIRNQRQDKHKELRAVQWFGGPVAASWGWRSFLRLGEFEDLANGYLDKNTCIVEAEVTVLGIVKKIP